jgi:hypothetical protein
MMGLLPKLAMGVYVGSLMIVAIGNFLALTFLRSPLSMIFFLVQVFSVIFE